MNSSTILTLSALLASLALPACYAHAEAGGDATTTPIAMVPDGHWEGQETEASNSSTTVAPPAQAPKSPYPAECNGTAKRQDVGQNGRVCYCGEGESAVWWSWYQYNWEGGDNVACPPPDPRQPLFHGPHLFAAPPPFVVGGTPAIAVPPPSTVDTPPQVLPLTPPAVRTSSFKCSFTDSGGVRLNVCEADKNGAKVQGQCVGASFVARRYTDVDAYAGGPPCTCPGDKLPVTVAASTFPNSFSCPQDLPTGK